MKVIKRDGRAVDYDRQKIMIAISKANNEVTDNDKASKEEIKQIMEYIESLGKKRMLVEDIQDIIEQKLMELDRYDLAKKYIVYRYTRALVRKSNTTDESILGLIRNENRNFQSQNPNSLLRTSNQRDYIAGEVSKDLTRRLLLPEKITKAEQNGVLYFHDADYFIQPIINSSVINIKDMLEKGTVINGKKIKTPENFLDACMILSQIITVIANSQYGEQTIDLMCLGKYLRKSFQNLNSYFSDEKLITYITKAELKSGIKNILYQINTLNETNIKRPLIKFVLYLNTKDEYIKENTQIIEELINQVQDISEFLSFEYIFDKEDEINILKNKIKNIKFISSENYKLDYEFNQGIVTINLPQIALMSDEDINKFWNLLDERLEICKEALMCRHYALLGTSADMSPLHWKYGGIARLNSGENIDELLTNKYSTLSLGYLGTEELASSMEKDLEFSNKVMKKLADTIKQWNKESNVKFVLYNTPKEIIGDRFVKKDKEIFGTIKNITDKEYYSNLI